MILVGFLYRLILTSEGNFIFNMDNARDMIDVRGMVELGKWRLIGPTTGIDGVYTGPGWYYLLVIPYFFSGGNPYSSILMMIIFWTVGAILIGVVLRTKGVYAVISAMTVWSFAPSIILVTQYALNPNPVVLLAPLLVYVLYHYLKSGSIVYYLFAWMFAGLYFNLEMAAGICVPAVIITVSLLRNGLKDLFSRRLIVGVITMSIFCIPQVVFELRHDFFMSKAILSHLLEPGSYNFFDKFIYSNHCKLYYICLCSLDRCIDCYTF
jgi:4-amino-4-deoxy-L-arabinose transferase-like glycosyltransferase